MKNKRSSLLSLLYMHIYSLYTLHVVSILLSPLSHSLVAESNIREEKGFRECIECVSQFSGGVSLQVGLQIQNA